MRIKLISFLICFSILSVTISTVILNILFPYRNGKTLFNLYVVLVTLERVWETFYTTKEKEPRKLAGDWTWILVIFTYLITGLSTIFEFFMFPKGLNIIVSIISSFVFILAFLLRIWAVNTLADQWTT
ncbi:MAG: hypothetical protein NC923_08110, partial [Candidatus Omnitrophica bacterium]|nr:hypothetical protein [Candidatus Omnitrophota bacterium]